LTIASSSACWSFSASTVLIVVLLLAKLLNLRIIAEGACTVDDSTLP
jgi:hypothetical protein